MVERELCALPSFVFCNALNFEIRVAIERRSACCINVLDCRVTMDRSRKAKGCVAKREA